MELNQSDPEIIDLIARYDKWRRIYRYAGISSSAPDAPDFENGRLYFRDGYPLQDWTAYIVEQNKNREFRVLRASTEPRNTPAEAQEAVFSRIEDAGKFILHEVATSLRVQAHLESITQKWRAEGLDHRVDKSIISDDLARYTLRSDPSTYFIAYSGGIQPYNRLLPLSYDELEKILLEDFPPAVISQLASENA